jgi:PLP dependent protein
MTTKERVEKVRERIAAAALKVGRDPGGILVVAVAKAFPAAAVSEAMAAGIDDIGENRVQEARAKIPEVDAPCRWHLVGHLQTNKVRLALQLFDWIQSLDSMKLARELERAGSAFGKQVNTLMQINFTLQPSRSGVAEANFLYFLEQSMSLPHVRIKGFMTMPPFDPNPEVARPYFRRLRELRDAAATRFPELPLAHLSMGMSHDFEVAIEEGATMLRIGTAIFGPRPTG